MKQEVTIHAQDIIIPLATKVKLHMNITATAIFTKYSVNGVVPFDKFVAMVKEVLGFAVSNAEEKVLHDYLAQIAGKSNAVLNKTDIEKIITENYRLGLNTKANMNEANRALNKMRKVMRNKTINFITAVETYQSAADKKRSEVCVRNMKLMLYTQFNLTSFEVENLVAKWDDDQNGFISIVDLQKELVLSSL